MKKIFLIVPLLLGTMFIAPAFADGGDVDKALLGLDSRGGNNKCSNLENNTVLCWRNTGGSVGNLDCTTKDATCTEQSTGSDYAVCQKIFMTKTTKKLRCVAKRCKNGYYLWVSSRNVSNPQTYDDYKSEGVCIHKSWCDKHTCSTCTEKTLHTFKWHGQNATDEICYNKSSLEQPESNTDPEQYVNMEPEQNDESVIIPKNDVPPAIPPKTCKLTFSNGTQIDNVVSAYSAKRDLARTRYNTLNRNAHPDIASLYRDYQNNYIRQNVDATGLNYNIQTPHLFDLTKINNIDIPKDQSKRLKSAGYVSFNCDSENPFIIEEPRATASIVCTAKFECKTATIFDQLDPDLDNYFVRSYVWKDAEGNFNTARLISDSVAGVVLGTVGGVVTSSIVKKNQVKKGFESLKCTIGGQDIATYGDEFTIGLK